MDHRNALSPPSLVASLRSLSLNSNETSDTDISADELEASSQPEVLCTCSHTCGHSGEMVHPQLRRNHLETERLVQRLGSQLPSAAPEIPPYASTQPAEPRPSSVEDSSSLDALDSDSEPSDSDDEEAGQILRNTMNAGRQLLTAAVDAMDQLSALEREYEDLEDAVFDSSAFVFVKKKTDSGPVFYLDTRAPTNIPYLDKVARLKHLLRRINDMEGAGASYIYNELSLLHDTAEELLIEHESILTKALERAKENAGGVLDDTATAHAPGVPEPRDWATLGPLASAFMLFQLALTTVMGLSDRSANAISAMVKNIVTIALVLARGEESGRSQAEYLLREVPNDARTAPKRLNVPSPTIIYAVCPACCAIYRPLPAGNSKPYQELCTWVDEDSKTCGTGLLRSRIRGDRLHWRAIRRFPFLDPTTYLAGLISRSDLEPYFEGKAEPDVQDISFDIWDSELFANAKGKDGKPFLRGPGHIALILAVDWFNPYHNLEAKKKWSVGGMYMVCANLPLELRYKLENVGLSTLPGPLEPSLEQVNHFVKPIVDPLITLYNPGVWVPRTKLYPDGRLMRAMLMLLIADLLGLRHIAGFGYPAHRLFCSYCTLTRDLMDDFSMKWTPRSLVEHMQRSSQWKSASSAERAILTKEFGLRYSALNELEYWDPFQQAPVDILHCLLAILSKHARGAWHMDVNLEAGDGTSNPFRTPPDVMVMAKAEHALVTQTSSNLASLGVKVLAELADRRGLRTGGKTKKQLLESLVAWRITRGIALPTGQLAPGQSSIVFQPPSLAELKASLEFEEDPVVIAAALARITDWKTKSTPKNICKPIKKPVLRSVCYQLGLDFTGVKEVMTQSVIDLQAGVIKPAYSPGDIASSITPGAGTRPPTTETEKPRFYPIMGSEILGLVRGDIDAMITPGWFKRPPRNVGSAKQGKLSSKEWRSTYTTVFPVTLIKLWGRGYTQVPVTDQQKVLDNFLHLYLATLLCTQDRMTESVIQAYTLHMVAYLEGFKTLYPTHSIIPYHHLALHLPDFLRLLGPWSSHSTGPFETFNGMIQNIPTNSVFGDLEVTLSKTFLATSGLRALLVDEGLPSELRQLAGTMEKHLATRAMGGMARDTSYSSEGYSNRWVPLFSPEEPISIEELGDVLSQTLPDLGLQEAVSARVCKGLRLNDMTFSPGSTSARDSQISYCDSRGILSYGRIHSIFTVPQTNPTTPDAVPHIFLLVEQYLALSAEDARFDPFENHPLVGRNGYDLLRTVYAECLPQLVLIQAKDIVGHIARCELTGSKDLKYYSKKAIVTVQLDRGFIAKWTSPDKFSTVADWCARRELQARDRNAQDGKRKHTEDAEKTAVDNTDDQPRSKRKR